MIIIENKYLVAHYAQERQYLEIVWKPQTLQMLEPEYKIVMKELLAQIQNHVPQKILLDNMQFAYSIAPQTQLWTQEHILASLKLVGKIRIGLVCAEDFFSQVSWEQMLDNYQPRPSQLDFRFYENKNEAHAWLFSYQERFCA